MSLCETIEEEEDVHTPKAGSPEPSCVSMKSDASMHNPPGLSDGAVTSDPTTACKMSLCETIEGEEDAHTPKAGSPEPSCVSMKSDASMHNPPGLSDGAVTSDPNTACKMSLCETIEEEEDVHTPKAGSPEPSCVSMKSDASMHNPPGLSDGAVTSDPTVRRCNMSRSVKPSLTCSDKKCQTLIRQRVKDQHKTSMKNKYESLFEGINLEENQTLLNRIYTQLYIVEGESEGVNNEHEVLQMEKTSRTKHSQDTPIYCNDVFKPLHEGGYKRLRIQKRDKIKTVLTKGIAGIGKTISVQKFILDWSEGKANQDVDFMFVLPFRELNLIKDHQYSLHRLLLDFHPELQDLDSKIYKECKVVFIFDGLDESRIELKFTDRQKVRNVTKSSSVNVLMSNLIRGDLLPSALIWITSRPAAANQIPSEYINRLTEIQGFTETQKEEYFRKRISDQHQASRIISHIRRARSLHIMCHIPVFCWISSTVLQKLLEEDLRSEIPQTLTEMYIHFLLIQINTRNQKYEERDPEKPLQSNKEVIVKLAELAFKQLMKGNVMFYEEDLIESGIGVTDAVVYSGICTEIFKEESVIHQRKVYSFIHLSFQEFLAAFFVIYSQAVKNVELVNLLLTEQERYSQIYCLYDLLIAAVDKSLKSKNGHLDLFLRFLLGVSLESNQTLLQDLLPHTVNSSESIKRITQYIKTTINVNDDEMTYKPAEHLSAYSDDDYYGDRTRFRRRDKRTYKPVKHLSADFDEDDYRDRTIFPIRDEMTNKPVKHLSADRCISLFLCLLEMKDQTLFREIQEFVKSENHSPRKLSPSHCSTIAYMLQISEEVLDEFDLKKYNTSDEGRRRLIPAVVSCRKALLAGCNLTKQCCGSLSSCLQASNSLRELDLSHNNLYDSGVKLLSNGLESSHCQLNALRLSGCHLTDQCCRRLSLCLQSSNSLRELDLSYNDVQDSGVKLLSDGLESSHCQLNALRLSFCNLTDQCCESLSSCLQSSNSLRELDLSYNDVQDSGVKLLSDGLKSSHCQLNVLRLSCCMVTEKGCCFLASALSSNPSHLRELDLSYNHPGPSLVKLLSDPNYRLDKLNVDHGGEIRITAGPKKYACDLTLDLNTANTHLILSERNRKVTHMSEKQPYPDHPERFDLYYPQVLCRESLTGRCYWEAEWSSGGVNVSVAYKGISRKGWRENCWFGLNENSWSLNCCNNGFSTKHNNKNIDIPVTSSSKRVGVYLNWLDGTLSFYSVSDTHTLTHLHTYNTTFTEPLYPGFRLFCVNSSLSLCEIKLPPVGNN